MPRSLQAFQALVERHAGSDALAARRSRRSSISRPSAVFCVLGILLIVLGRKKKPLIGYARD